MTDRSIPRKTLLLCGLATLLAHLPGSLRAKDNWTLLESRNFAVVSNASEARSRRLQLKLEQFRSAFLKIFTLPDVATVPLTVVIFKDDRSFTPYKFLRDGKPAPVGGYYQPGREKDIIAVNIAGQDPMHAIYHEYTHRLTAQTKHPWPAWVKEGIAEFYSSFDILKNQVTLGAPISNHVHFLRRQNLIPVDRLKAIDRNSPEYNEREKRGVFYAQSWALVHWSMLGQEGDSPLLKYCQLLDTGMDWDAAFDRAYELSPDQLDKELQWYIRKDTFNTVRVRIEEAKVDQEIRARQLSESEALVFLGDLLFLTDRPEEAETHYRRALELDETLSAPYERLASIAKQRDNYEEAKTLLVRAASSKTEDYLVHHRYAETLMEEALHFGRDSGIDQQLFETIHGELRSAMRLKPDFPAPYHLMARLHLATEIDPAEGLEMITKALTLEPQSQEFGMTYAELQLLNDDYEGARKTLQQLLASGLYSGLEAYAKLLLERIQWHLADKESLVEETEASMPGVRSSEQNPVGPLDEPPERGPISNCRPSFTSTRGLPVVQGTLLKMECPGDLLVFVVETDGREQRFVQLDLTQPVIFSCEVPLEAIRCGPMNMPAVVYFRSPPEQVSEYRGEAVAIELRR